MSVSRISRAVVVVAPSLIAWGLKLSVQCVPSKERIPTR
jgi:hypothetical protein